MPPFNYRMERRRRGRKRGRKEGRGGCRISAYLVQVWTDGF